MSADFEGLLAAGPLTEWLDAHVPELGDGPLEAAVMHGGTSNVILSLRRGRDTMILRCPPRVPPPNSERTVMREARVLSALHGTAVPHPHCYGSCDDPSVIGAPFYVMERVPGWAAELRDERIHHPAPFDRPPHEHGVAYAMVDGLIALANVDYRAIGLTDYGKPDGFLERQVDRWARQLDSYADLYGYTRRDLPGYDVVERWLRAHTPSESVAAIMHGDVGTPNALFAPEPPARLNALIDWELSTIGDPLIDLAWFTKGLRDERQPDRVPATALYDAVNFPTRQELARHYSAGTGRDVANFDYYLVLAMFKSGCLLEYKVAQAAAGLLPAEAGRLFSRLVLANFAAAAELVERFN